MARKISDLPITLTFNLSSDYTILEQNGVVKRVKGINYMYSVRGPQGLQGSVGVQGLQGFQGSQGFQGIQGEQGADGTGVSIKGSLSSINDLPQSTNTISDAYLIDRELWIWDGFVWDNAGDIQGPVGIQGPIGPQGIQGPIGLRGEAGSQGVQGMRGVQGPQGETGLTGLQGIQGIQGIQGVVGPQGVVGTQGIQGLRGLQGIQGIRGDAGFSIIGSLNSVISLPLEGNSIRDAYLVTGDLWIWSGTSWLSAGHIQGPMGDMGATGLQGEIGITGSQGIQGLKGDQGVQGIQGLKGDQGVQGIQGIQGEDGVDGTGISIKGSLSSTLLLPLTGNYISDSYIIDQELWVWSGDYWVGAGNIKGPKGDQGIQGDQGIRGVQGLKGDQGVQGVQGIQGIQGVQGLKGDRGIKGDLGDTGPRGYQGIQGEQGIQGVQGLKGEQGIQGIRGIQGIQGIEGPQGERGIQGPLGLVGPQGPSAPKPTTIYYEPSTKYVLVQSSWFHRWQNSNDYDNNFEIQYSRNFYIIPFPDSQRSSSYHFFEYLDYGQSSYEWWRDPVNYNKWVPIDIYPFDLDDSHLYAGDILYAFSGDWDDPITNKSVDDAFATVIYPVSATLEFFLENTTYIEDGTYIPTGVMGAVVSLSGNNNYPINSYNKPSDFPGGSSLCKYLKIAIPQSPYYLEPNILFSGTISHITTNSVYDGPNSPEKTIIVEWDREVNWLPTKPSLETLLKSKIFITSSESSTVNDLFENYRLLTVEHAPIDRYLVLDLNSELLLPIENNLVGYRIHLFEYTSNDPSIDWLGSSILYTVPLTAVRYNYRSLDGTLDYDNISTPVYISLIDSISAMSITEISKIVNQDEVYMENFYEKYLPSMTQRHPISANNNPLKDVKSWNNYYKIEINDPANSEIWSKNDELEKYDYDLDKIKLDGNLYLQKGNFLWCKDDSYEDGPSYEIVDVESRMSNGFPKIFTVRGKYLKPYDNNPKIYIEKYRRGHLFIDYDPINPKMGDVRISGTKIEMLSGLSGNMVWGDTHYSVLPSIPPVSSFLLMADDGKIVYEPVYHSFTENDKTGLLNGEIINLSKEIYVTDIAWDIEKGQLVISKSNNTTSYITFSDCSVSAVNTNPNSTTTTPTTSASSDTTISPISSTNMNTESPRYGTFSVDYQSAFGNFVCNSTTGYSDGIFNGQSLLGRDGSVSRTVRIRGTIRNGFNIVIYKAGAGTRRFIRAEATSYDGYMPCNVPDFILDPDESMMFFVLPPCASPTTYPTNFWGCHLVMEFSSSDQTTTSSIISSTNINTESPRYGTISVSYQSNPNNFVCNSTTGYSDNIFGNPSLFGRDGTVSRSVNINGSIRGGYNIVIYKSGVGTRRFIREDATDNIDYVSYTIPNFTLDPDESMSFYFLPPCVAPTEYPTNTWGCSNLYMSFTPV